MENLVHVSDETRAATEAMGARWKLLAQEIAKPEGISAAGELAVIGTGLAHCDIMLNDEAIIRSADHVFYCLYDRVTQIWIDRMRPDAFDLRILYQSGRDRHDTYVCMAEALLHYVRRGKKVVAIYYGHPGFFATPAHRAIQIARKEGHAASMRPGISALDYLVADVGFDPMIPGLLSYEASDLLLRKRRLDPTLHTVLWQVGTVGEFQFAPNGFENHGFDMLLDELEAAYGGDAPVIHYIASQYVGVESLVDRHTISAMRMAATRSRVTALSTFYLPPASLARTNRERSASLGFSQDARDETHSVDHDISGYGPGERVAISWFAAFSTPEHYRAATPSPAADFLLKLSRHPDLQARYRADPEVVVKETDITGLSERARKLLAIPHPLAFNAAMAEPAEQN
ncbi:hypothetical protein FHS95_000335 [Sphingomonas naasensis]|uniref:Tetrapyrrole methylase domain-containing protein n=1 Tax=Sphingomonas naasensis TaxID=1344951 RepID=A0A4S1WWG3_9SPHN|nr:SAM-dependent methyltransferase [Sphingomonas naasensis]NIJ18666.1 hypothetical protein [Sphingomonas naasensis]TGX45906.1 hypothetical protein E5A74_01660 [Sphingomonas naasensis]